MAARPPPLTFHGNLPRGQRRLHLQLGEKSLEFKKKPASYSICLLSGSPGIHTMPLPAAWHGCHKTPLKSVSMETGWLLLPLWLLLLGWLGWVWTLGSTPMS